MSTGPAAAGWDPKSTPPGYLFTCDFLLNTITKYIDHIEAVPIVQGNPVMVERYNDVISRNALTCQIIFDEDSGAPADAFKRMRMDTKSLNGERVFEFSSGIKEKAKILMEKLMEMPDYGMKDERDGERSEKVATGKMVSPLEVLYKHTEGPH